VCETDVEPTTENVFGVVGDTKADIDCEFDTVAQIVGVIVLADAHGVPDTLPEMDTVADELLLGNGDAVSDRERTLEFEAMALLVTVFDSREDAV